IYSKGFHPKPQLAFAPALGLGVAALGELCDVKIDFDGAGAELLERLRAASPPGFVVEGVERMAATDGAMSKRLAGAEYAAWLPAAPAGLRVDGLEVKRLQKRVWKTIDVGRHLETAHVVDGDEADELRAQLDWPDGGAVVTFRLKIEASGGAKPSEVIEALTGAAPPEGTRYARIGFLLHPAAPAAAAAESSVPAH